MTKAKLTELDRVANDARLGEMRAIKELQEARLRNVLTSDALDAASAEAARLREALEPFMRWAAQLDSPPNWVPDGCPILASPGEISDFSVGQLRRVRAALSASSGEWLSDRDARIRREARAEALREAAERLRNDPTIFGGDIADMILDMVEEADHA